MTATGTASPVRANFPVRRMDFSFSETPKYWWDGQPFMTQFMNNLSSLFPYGENSSSIASARCATAWRIRN